MSVYVEVCSEEVEEVEEEEEAFLSGSVLVCSEEVEGVEALHSLPYPDS